MSKGTRCMYTRLEHVSSCADPDPRILPFGQPITVCSPERAVYPSQSGEEVDEARRLPGVKSNRIVQPRRTGLLSQSSLKGTFMILDCNYYWPRRKLLGVPQEIATNNVHHRSRWAPSSVTTRHRASSPDHHQRLLCRPLSGISHSHITISPLCSDLSSCMHVRKYHASPSRQAIQVRSVVAMSTRQPALFVTGA